MRAADVRDVLRGRPEMSSAYDVVVGALSECADVVLVRGGLAVGRFDEYSDLDFAAVVDRERAAEVLARADAAMASLGDILSRYTPAHRGLDFLHAYLVKRESSLIWIDISIETDGQHSSDREVVVWQRPGVSYRSPEATAGHVDLDVLAERCVGWIWYVHNKTRRGENAEAERCLASLRMLGLVPLLRLEHGLPQLDYRHLEKQLPSRALARLYECYPHQMSGDGIRTALDQIIEQIANTWPAVSPADEQGLLPRLATLRTELYATVGRRER